jgi:hypothetical protein
MDIERYLHEEAVLARPPSQLYRLQKLVRRNRVVFASIAALSFALIAGFGTSTRLFFLERAARREAEQAARTRPCYGSRPKHGQPLDRRLRCWVKTDLAPQTSC